MRMHYSACLEMLHRLQDVDRFAAVLSDFVTLCVQAGVDQQQVRPLETRTLTNLIHCFCCSD
jgi:hypothetical protein